MLEYIEFPNSFMDMGSCGNSILGRIGKMEVGIKFLFFPSVKFTKFQKIARRVDVNKFKNSNT